MVSFDVVSLFTSIPLDLAKQCTEDLLQSCDTDVPAIALLEFLDLCMETNLSFDQQYYQQMKGAPMGSPISGFLAEITMQKLEATALPLVNPKLWLRYVDDTFVIVKKDQLETLHNTINSTMPGIKFTLEKEVDKELPFLDVLVQRKTDGTLRTSVYRKQTYAEVILHYESNHPISHKRGPASCRPFIQSSCLASPQMDRPLSEGVPQPPPPPPPPPPPTIRCPFTRPWRGSRRGRGYTRSASYSMRSLEDSPASDFGPPPPPPLPLDHPPWQKLAPPSAETWGRARSLQVDASVSTSTSVPASPLEGRHASHLCPRPLWRLGSSESRSDTTQSARPSTGSRQRAITQPLHNEPFTNGHASAVRRQDLQWKRKSFKRSNGYDAADLERAASFDSYAEEIEPLVQASSMSNPQDVGSDYSMRPDSSRGPTATATTSDLGGIGQREQVKPQPSDDTDVVIECQPDEVDDICEAGGSGGGGGAARDTAHEDETSAVQAESADAGSPGSHRVIRVVAESGSRTPSRTSHPPSRQVLSELAALGFNNRNEYWEHSAFGRARICAICLASIASLCLLYSFSSSTWAYSGPSWQGGAVCILLAAIGLGLLGIGLSIVGYTGSDLLKRLYYFHSGGEIFFLAGFTTFLSLGIYRSYAQSNLVNAATGDVELTFGAADTVGWVAGVLYFITAFCLLMDEFIHEMAKMSTRWPCLGVLLRFGALQIARFSRWRHACSLRWRRCCKRGRRQKRLSRVPMTSTSASATHSSSFGLQEAAYRPTTGQLISKKRGRRS
ncbi:hypothetical protein SprV_0702364200 [Sparganum proliferum]